MQRKLRGAETKKDDYANEIDMGRFVHFLSDIDYEVRDKKSIKWLNGEKMMILRVSSTNWIYHQKSFSKKIREKDHQSNAEIWWLPEVV